MSECSHDCSSCGQKDCGSHEIPKEQLNEFSRVKKVIGIVSGKGGVGKSLVTAIMAAATSKRGFNTAILDADITGPSIPRMFGIKEHAMGDGKDHIFPCKSSGGVDIMSINLLLESDTDPVVWRGPVIAGIVRQFWTGIPEPPYRRHNSRHLTAKPGFHGGCQGGTHGGTYEYPHIGHRGKHELLHLP